MHGKVKRLRRGTEAKASLKRALSHVRHNWPERSAFYACRNFMDLNRGDAYEDIKPVYQISFVDFTVFEEYPALYSTYRLMERNKQYEYTDKLTIGMVDLTKTELATEEDKKYKIDEWAQLFKADTWEEIKMLAVNNANIAEAAETIYKLSEDERIRQQCQAREDFLREQRSVEVALRRRDETIEKQKKEIEQMKKELKAQKAAHEKLCRELKLSRAIGKFFGK